MRPMSAYATVEQRRPEEMDPRHPGQPAWPDLRLQAVLPHLRLKGPAAAIINVASALADRSIPLQAAYCAAKHGIKGFTEALRLELEHERSGITLTLVLPSSINTPLFDHARSKLGVKPMPSPRSTSRASSPRRSSSPASSRGARSSGRPGKTCRRSAPQRRRSSTATCSSAARCSTSRRRANRIDGQDNLFQPSRGRGSSTGDFGQQSKAASIYTRLLELHPVESVPSSRRRPWARSPLAPHGALADGASPGPLGARANQHYAYSGRSVLIADLAGGSRARAARASTSRTRGCSRDC